MMEVKNIEKLAGDYYMVPCTCPPAFRSEEGLATPFSFAICKEAINDYLEEVTSLPVSEKGFDMWMKYCSMRERDGLYRYADELSGDDMAFSWTPAGGISIRCIESTRAALALTSFISRQMKEKGFEEASAYLEELMNPSHKERRNKW